MKTACRMKATYRCPSRLYFGRRGIYDSEGFASDRSLRDLYLPDNEGPRVMAAEGHRLLRIADLLQAGTADRPERWDHWREAKSALRGCERRDHSSLGRRRLERSRTHRRPGRAPHRIR